MKRVWRIQLGKQVPGSFTEKKEERFKDTNMTSYEAHCQFKFFSQHGREVPKLNAKTSTADEDSGIGLKSMSSVMK